MQSEAPAVLGLLIFLGSVATACGTTPVGLDACRRIEDARCERARSLCPAYGINDDTALEACLESARDRCLHGLASGVEPSAPALEACVHALETTSSCDVIAQPETAPECAFIVPVESADAAADSTADADVED